MGFASGNVTDWTNGLGAFPAGGTITVQANDERQWFYVQNRDVGQVNINYTCMLANGTNGASAGIVSLNPAASSGQAGGTEERDVESFMPEGVITITGTAGQKVTVLTG